METQTVNSEQSQGFTNRQKIAGYVGVFLLSFFVFLTVKFPYELLTQGILSRVKSSFPVPINAESAVPRLPLGIKMEQVKIGPFSKRNPAIISLDSLTIKAALFKAIKKTLDATISAELYGGSVKIFIEGSGSAADVNFKADNVGLDILKELLPKLFPIKLAGEISGSGKMKINAADPNGDTGEFHLNSTNLDLDKVNIKITKTDFHFKRMEADIVLEPGGALKVKSLVLEGEPSGFEISGTVTLSRPDLSQSILDLEMSLHPTPEFEKLFPLELLQKDSRGFPSGKMRGTIARPQFP